MRRVPLAGLVFTAVLSAALIVSTAVALACPPHWHRPPPPDPRASPRARLSITAQPGTTEVRLDGRVLGYAPLIGHYLDAGTHSLRLKASCGETRRTIRVAPGEDVRLTIDVCRARHTPQPHPI